MSSGMFADTQTLFSEDSNYVDEGKKLIRNVGINLATEMRSLPRRHES